MDVRDTAALRAMGDRSAFAAIHYQGDDWRGFLVRCGGRGREERFAETLVLQAPARALIAAADHPEVEAMEIIDDRIVGPVDNLLHQLGRIYREHRVGIFRPAVVNVSIGPPRALLNKRRAAEAAVRRAYRAITRDLDIPVVTSAGNDGPAPGAMNPWADSEGVIVAAAADSEGRAIGALSSRPTQFGPESAFALFAGYGMDSIGANGGEKTPAMLEAERRIDLASRVGAENLHLYRVDSGTSYAAAEISRIIGFAHQFTAALLAHLDGLTPTQTTLPPFLRAYVDSGVDRTHPIFANRLADEPRKYGGLPMEIAPARKQALIELLATANVDFNIGYGAGMARRFLKVIARPISGAAPEEAGFGFVDRAAAAGFIRSARADALVDLFAEDGDPRAKGWRAAFARAGEAPLLTAAEANAITGYCEKYDLILMRPLFQ